LKDQLYNYVDTLKQDDWDVYLPVVQLMYNTTVSLTTGYTPMLLMTGREARMPSWERLCGNDPRNPNCEVTSTYVEGLVSAMKEYQKFASGQIQSGKDRLDVRVRKPLEFKEYEPGQKFFRARRPKTTFNSSTEKESWKISMKLLERFEGPYEIIRKINPVLYDANIDGKEVRVHAINMKPF